MKRQRTKKLSIARESLRSLTVRDLRAPVGGTDDIVVETDAKPAPRTNVYTTISGGEKVCRD